jgi:hypothetical protein
LERIIRGYPERAAPPGRASSARAPRLKRVVALRAISRPDTVTDNLRITDSAQERYPVHIAIPSIACYWRKHRPIGSRR